MPQIPLQTHQFCGPPRLSEITTLLTIYALIGDDMRLIFSEKAADDIFNVITATTMAVFGLEVIINTLGKQGYLGDESAGVSSPSSVLFSPKSLF